MNRLERISSILIQLQSRPVVTAQQIAKQFDISLRTVYRDIKVLEETGIPILSNSGVGYSLIEGYKLPPLMFSQEEAIAFLTAEKLIESMTDTQNIQYFKSGMNKVRAVLRTVEKDHLSTIEENIRVLGGKLSQQELPKDITQAILKSIIQKRIMHIEYFTERTQNCSIRDIEPVGYFYSHSNWYLIAFCNLKNEYRNFRIDRIKNFKISNNNFTKTHLSLNEYIKKNREKELPISAIIEISKSDMYKVKDNLYYGYTKECEEDGCIRLYFSIFNIEHFARWCLSYGDIIKIISPRELKNKRKEIIDNIITT